MATMDMSKAKKVTEEAEAAADAVEETAVVQAATSAVVSSVQEKKPDMAELLEDLLVPTLAVKHKMTEPEAGSEAESCPVGNFILDKTYDLGTDLEFIPIADQTYYEESLEFGSSDVPRVYATKAEVVAVGGMITKGKGEDLFHKAAKLLVLVKKPDCVSDEAADQFVYEVGDSAYSLAMIYAKGSSYIIHRRVFTAEKTVKWMLGDKTKGRFSLGTKMIVFQATGKPGPVPKVGNPKPSTEEERELAASCLNFDFSE